MLKALARAFTGLLLLPLLLLRADEDRPREHDDPDVQRLLHVPFLAFGGVGIAGRISEGEAAFEAIARKKDSIRFFIAAFEYGDAPARCYALIALREMNPEIFRQNLTRVRKNPPKKIMMMHGCVMSTAKPETIYAAIEAGKYAEHLKRHQEKAGNVASDEKLPLSLNRTSKTSGRSCRIVGSEHIR
jgi:hypothetical protein